MTRLTTDQLVDRMRVAQTTVPEGFVIRHVRTGYDYMVRGHSLRVGDLELLVQYSPLFGPIVIFSRTLSEIQAKFVRHDGQRWALVHDDDAARKALDGKP